MTERRKVLLIGWDGADWEHITPLLDAGKLPALQALVERGVLGNLATLEPVLSPMLWSSVATGKQAWKHGIYGFVEPDPAGGGSRPSSSRSRKTKALWNMLSESGLRSNVVNWWASHPAEKVDGCVVSNHALCANIDSKGAWCLPANAICPAEFAAQLAPLRVFGHELAGEQLLPFVPRGAEVDQDQDNRLAVLAENLAEMLTTHNYATHLIEHSSWDFMATYYTAIDHFCHGFIEYYPPKLPWISDRDFELYQHVIESVYRFSDMTLATLVKLAGPDATIILCSDHGFHSGELRLRSTPNEPTGPTYWHRQYGIFVAAGPGITQDQRIYGACLLDIAPTILHLFGLPVGRDMDGQVLRELFEKPSDATFIDSWDDDQSAEPQLANADQNQAEDYGDSEVDQALMDQFIALGYIDAQRHDKLERLSLAQAECDFNLARNLAWCGKHNEANRLLEELVHQFPWESRFIVQWCRGLLAAGQFESASRLLRAAYDLDETTNLAARYLWIETQLGLGETQNAIGLLDRLRRRNVSRPEPLLQVGNCYLRLRRSADAINVFHDVLKMHANSVEAHQGLSTAYCRLGDNQATVDHALRALSLVYHLPRAHLNLGIALARSEDFERAIVAFSTALKINPKLWQAHRWLSTLYSRFQIDLDKARYHADQAERVWAEHKMLTDDPTRADAERTASGRLDADRSVSSAHAFEIDFPAIPSEAERARLEAEFRPLQNNGVRESGKTFVIVSGLPRSGTSLMMQMLAAGGLQPKTDGERQADMDNPRGYFEWEAIRKLASRPQLLDEEGLDRLAIKIVSPLLPYLPYQHRYKVLFMLRPIGEVALSQQKMIAHRRNATPLADDSSTEPTTLDLETSTAQSLTDEHLASELERHRLQATQWLQNHPRADVLFVDYIDLLQSPLAWVENLKTFLGADRLPHLDLMAATVDPQLHRNRG